MNTNKMKYAAIRCAIIAIAACSSSAYASLVPVKSIPLNLTVTTLSCGASFGSSSIALPKYKSSDSTIAGYLSSNGYTHVVLGNGDFVSTSGYEQKVTITCGKANVVITSVAVKSGSGAKRAGVTDYQLLTDTAGAVAGGVESDQGFSWGAELTKINDAEVFYAFQKATDGALQAYATAFQTGALNKAHNSTASFSWHPTANKNTTATEIGTPKDGSFKGSYDVVINY